MVSISAFPTSLEGNDTIVGSMRVNRRQVRLLYMPTQTLLLALGNLSQPILA